MSRHDERLGRLRRLAEAEAEPREGVLSRRDLRGLGVDDAFVRREIRAGRWRRHGNQTIAVHTGMLTSVAHRWRAVWEVGERHALIDGVTALQAAGVSGYADDTVHVSVRHNARVAPVPGVWMHKVIRRVPDEPFPAGVPRTRPAIAALRAAHWATSDKQAALLLVLPVQQRIVTGAQLADAASVVRGRTRRSLIQGLVQDIADGAHSLGELDFVAACRRRGLPEPSRQVLRQGRGRKVYLDVYWDEAALVVEVDGTGHVLGLQHMHDDLRQNEISLGKDLVLRVGIIGWRLHREAYLDQVVRAYRARVGRSAA
jgi:very-short-patch-repair endonuclease